MAVHAAAVVRIPFLSGPARSSLLCFFGFVLSRMIFPVRFAIPYPASRYYQRFLSDLLSNRRYHLESVAQGRPHSVALVDSFHVLTAGGVDVLQHGMESGAGIWLGQVCALCNVDLAGPCSADVLARHMVAPGTLRGDTLPDGNAIHRQRVDRSLLDR